MTRLPSSFGTLVVINAKALWAVCLGVVGFFTWPTTPEWWGLGFISICCALSGVGLMIEAIRAAFRLHYRNKAIAEFSEQGARPKTARTVSQNELEKSGML